MFNNKLTLYITGFLLSIALTLAAFFVVTNPGFLHFNSTAILIVILILAAIQFLVQAMFFLHLGPGSSRWDLAIFASTIILILIIVVGSIWIMNHLNYNMTPQQIQQYLIDQSG